MNHEDRFVLPIRTPACSASSSVKEKFFRYLIPSIADILFISIFCYVSLVAGKMLLADGDTGYHIRVGEIILDTFSIPRHDLFSFTSPPLPWTAHEWLAEVVMALLHRAGGLTAVVVFFALMVAGTNYLFFRTIASCNGHILAAIPAAILFIGFSRIHWLARPHLFSLLFYVVWYWMIDRFKRGEARHLYLLPLTMIVWVNLHGGFIIGLILLGIYLVGEVVEVALARDRSDKEAVIARATHLAVITGLCVVASLLNPVGYDILIFPFRLVADSYVMNHVAEFLSPDFHREVPLRFFILLPVLVLGLSTKRLSVTELLLMLFFLNMGLCSIRYVPLFALFSAPMLVRQLSPLMEKGIGRWNFLARRAETIVSAERAAKGILWPVTAVFAVMLVWGSTSLSYGFDPKTKPVDAVEFLRKESIHGNMFNNDEFGDILIYQMPKQYRVFIDGRLDMYGAERMKEYSRVTNFEQGWQEVLARHGITWIFFDAHSPLSRYLLLDKQWHLVYADKVANIFVKNVPEHRRLIDRYPDVRPVPRDKEMGNGA